MSLETTLARAEAQAAEQEWKQHKRECPTCTTMARRCWWAQLCPAGTQIHDEQRAAVLLLAEQRKLDKQPIAGQAALFDVPAGAGPRSFSNGNGPGEDNRLPLDGWTIRPAHWWLW